MAVGRLRRTATEWYGAVCVWMVRLTSDLNSAVKSREVLNTRIALFLQVRDGAACSLFPPPAPTGSHARIGLEGVGAGGGGGP